MSDTRHHGPGGPHAPHDPRAAGDPTDAELNARGIVGFGLGLAILIAAILGAVWLLSAGLKSLKASHDPEPSPLAEANAPRLPPEPRLQTAPNDDIRTLRAHEDEVLTEYGPADQTTGTARIPIARAIELIARTGLPEPPAPAAAAPGTAATPTPAAQGGTKPPGAGR